MADDEAEGPEARVTTEDARVLAELSGLDLSPARLEVLAAGLDRFIRGMSLIDGVDLTGHRPPVRTFREDDSR